MDPKLTELIEAGDADDEVRVVARMARDAAPPPGVEVVSRFGDVATCSIRRGDLRRAWEAPETFSVKAPACLDADPVVGWHDPADSEGPGADDARRPAGLRETGKGVIIACLDWGCDFAHPDFRTPTGATRLLALWDQRPGPKPGTTPRYGYGVVHDRRAIDAALATRDPYMTLGCHPADADLGHGSHGSHCLSIAAGRGSDATPSGIAPAADLLFVHLDSPHGGSGKSLGDWVTLLDALDFCLGVAGARPIVISMSLGSEGGAHDGSSPLERALDFAVSAAPGRAICQSAGNYCEASKHTAGRLRPGEQDRIGWLTTRAEANPHQLEVWYAGADRIVARIESREHDLSVTVGPGESRRLELDGVTVGAVHHRIAEPNNCKNHVCAFLYPAAPGGRWDVVLEATDVADGRYHCWVERESGSPDSQSHLDETEIVKRYTTNSICNGLRTITVGAYDARSPDRPPAPFSSRGPTSDGRTKPDLGAPGVQVLAARSTPRGAPPGDRATRMSGTSMAAPCVAGIVALMFEAAGRPLTIAETRRHLSRTAEAADFPDDRELQIGDGYVDIERAVAAARAAGSTLAQEEPEMTPAASNAANGEATAGEAVLERVGLSPAALFDALRTGVAIERPDLAVTVIAGPGSRLSHEPRAGDILLSRVRGERDRGRLAVLHDGIVHDRERCRALGDVLHDTGRGLYAHVIGDGSEILAIRIADTGRRLPRQHMLIRLAEPETGEAEKAEEWEAVKFGLAETQADVAHPVLSLFPLPAAVMEALAGGLWSAAVGLAIKAGYSDATQLTNIVFYFRHPEMIGRKIQPEERDLAREWLAIRDRVVTPALASATPRRPPPAPPSREPAATPAVLSADRLVWPGHSNEELAFMKAVYVRQRETSKGHFVMDLPRSALDEVEGLWARKDAAAAVRVLLAEAKAALALERADCRIGIVSAYRPATLQFKIWQGHDPHGKEKGSGFPYYYRQAIDEGVVREGDFGPAAVQAMAKYMHGFIASPGYSNHQDGRAFDFGTGKVGKNGLGLLRADSWFRKWLDKNRTWHHFVPLSTEAWHWTYCPPTSASEAEVWPGEVAAPAIAAKRVCVPHVPLLAGHHGRAPDLILGWNDMPSVPEEIDVVVHLHGFWYPHLDLRRDILPVSGLDLAPIARESGSGRTRPTLTVLPRGNDTGSKQRKGPYNIYTFPALMTRNGLHDLARFALDRFAAEVRGRAPGIARLILTAHSGGGKALEDILATLDPPPHQVHVFDALYWPGDALVRWSQRRLAKDRAALAAGANAADYMPTQGGALRVFYWDRYRKGTRLNSLAVRDALASEISSDLAPWYRVEASKYDHFQIPHRYGWRILADASADVPDAYVEPAGSREAELNFEDEEESTAQQVEFEHARTEAAERAIDVVDGFLDDRTRLYKIALFGTDVHAHWPEAAEWESRYTDRALSEAAVLAAMRAMYDPKLLGAKVKTAWRRLVGHGVKFIEPRGAEIRLTVIQDPEMTKFAAACGYRPQQMTEKFRRERGQAKMLEYALGTAAKSFNTLAPRFSAQELTSSGVTAELIRHLLNRWFQSMVEVATTHSAAKPWRDAFERNPALVAGEREPTFADFDRATLDQWAQTILELAKATRITVNEQLAQDRADERKRARNEELRPHEIKVDDPVAFIVKTYDPTYPVRLDDYGWKGVVQGGQTLTNAKNEQILLLRAESSGVVYQNLVDKKFYEQTLEGFVQELVYGVYASAGQQSLPAAKLAIGMTRGFIEVVGMIFKPAKYALSAVDVINAAFQLKQNRAELERDYRSMKVAYANVDKLLPGVLPKIWLAVLDKPYVTLFNPLEHPDPLPWLKAVVELAIEHGTHAGVADAVDGILHAAWSGIKKGLDALLETARERALELAEQRLKALSVDGAAAIVSQVQALSEADRQRLVREIQELASNGVKLMEIVKTSLSW